MPVYVEQLLTKPQNEITDHPPGCSEARGYRCFAAMAEARFPTVRKSRWHNYDQLRAARISMWINIQNPTKYYLATRFDHGPARCSTCKSSTHPRKW